MRRHRLIGVMLALAVVVPMQLTTAPRASATSYCLMYPRTIWITSDGYIHAGAYTSCPKNYEIYLYVGLQRVSFPSGTATYTTLTSTALYCYYSEYCPLTGTLNVKYKPYSHNTYYCTRVLAWYEATSTSSKVSSGYYRECQLVT